MDLRGIEYLRNRLCVKRTRNNLRYEFYEMKNSIPPLMRDAPYNSSYRPPAIGWAAKAVDSLADRLVFKNFKYDVLTFNQIFALNNRDVFFDSAILSALITGCAFVWVYADADGQPMLEVIDGRMATGIVDPVTNMLTEGYAILETDKNGLPALEAYFTPTETVFIDSVKEWSVPNPTGYPLLVPVIYRPDAKRPLGHSRISRASMQLIESACRTVQRSEVTAEFYSFPQKYVTGLAPDAQIMDKWKATVSTLLSFDRDEETGSAPSLGQFQTSSMTPYTEQLRCFAALFAGENGLTLDDLGFVSDNPSSAEAIKASHETLRLTARKAQRVFGTCFKNVGFVAACLRDGFAYKRSYIRAVEPQWEPIFEPDFAALSSIGDGAIKINQAIPGYFDKDVMESVTGIAGGDTPPAEVTGD